MCEADLRPDAGVSLVCLGFLRLLIGLVASEKRGRDQVMLIESHFDNDINHDLYLTPFVPFALCSNICLCLSVMPDSRSYKSA